MEALMGENDDKTPTGDWYCSECDDYLCAGRVNHDETCDACGTTVEWIEADDPDAPEGRATVEEVVAHLRTKVARLTRDRDDLRVDAEVLSDRFAEVRALADTYIDIVNRTARALGIPEVDEYGASPSLHDVPERVAENRRKLYRLAEVVAEFIEDGLVDGDEATSRLQSVFQSEPHRQPLDGDDAARELRALMVEAGGNEPTDDDATQDPPGWGGGEPSLPEGFRIVAGGMCEGRGPVRCRKERACRRHNRCAYICPTVVGGGEVSDGE